MDMERRAVQKPAAADFLAFAETYSLMAAPDEVPFMLGLVSSPARIIDLWDGGARALIALIIDIYENATNAAAFMILASRNREIDIDLLAHFPTKLIHQNPSGRM